MRPWIDDLRRKRLQAITLVFWAIAIVGSLAQAADAPRLVIQTAQSHTLIAAWSADGALIASGGSDGSVLLWDAASGRQLYALKGPPGILNSLQFSADRALLMAGSGDGRILAWDVASGQLQAETPVGDGPVVGLAFTGGGNRMMVAVGSRVTVLDTVSKHNTVIDVAPYTVATAALSPDGATVAVARGRGKVQLFDASSGKARADLGSGDIWALRFSPDGKLLATGGDEGVIQFWNVADGTALRRIEGHVEGIKSLDFSPDGRVLASAGARLRMWETATGAPLSSGVKPGSYLTQAVYAPHGNQLLAVDSSGMEIWDVDAGARTRELRGRAGQVHHLAFSPDGRTLLAGGHAWDLDSGRSRGVGLHASPETYVRWSRDGTRVLGDGPLGPTLWDPSTWKDVLALPASDATVLSGTLSSDGKLVAAGFNDGTVRLWDARSGTDVGRLQVNDHAVRRLDISPDGRLLAAGGIDRPVTLWRIADRKQIHDTGESRPTAFGFTPDGKALALADDLGQVTMHPLGKAVVPPGVAHGAGVQVLRYSSDGRWLATGGFDHRIKVWDAATGKLLQTLVGHDDVISDIAFSPDGELLATTSRDATTRLWSRTDGKVIASLVQLSNAQWAPSSGVVIGPDGRFDAANLEGLRGLHWLLPAAPLRPVPLEAFMRDYYEPRLLPRLLSGETMPPVTPLTAIDTRAPQVRITGIAPDPADPDRVDVDVAVSYPSGAGAKPAAADLRLFRDGQLVGYVDGSLAIDPKSGTATTRLPVRLADPRGRGSVEFSAYAFNADRVKSETAYRSHFVEPFALPKPRRAILVNIGVDIYQSPAWDLGFAASDARLIGETLSARMRALGSFDEVVRIELVSDIDTPDAATKQAIREALRKLSRGVGVNVRPVGPDDVVIVSFSGHGAVDGEGVFHLLPHDIGEVSSRLVTPALLARGIRDDELGAWLRDVDAGEMVLILDACHSAASVAQRGFKPGPMGSRGLGQLAYDKGMRILAATQPEDVALESEATQHGLLSYALVKEGIEQSHADFRPQDRRIALAEWLGYALERVPTLAAEVRAGTVQSRGGSTVTVLNAPGSIAPRGLQRPALFDFREQAIDVEITTP